MAVRKKAPGLRVWCFVGAADRWAVSAREDGANLPEAGGPWRLLKSAVMTGADADERHVQQMVADEGFCCFEPESADSREQEDDHA